MEALPIDRESLLRDLDRLPVTELEQVVKLRAVRLSQVMESL